MLGEETARAVLRRISLHGSDAAEGIILTGCEVQTLADEERDKVVAKAVGMVECFPDDACARPQEEDERTCGREAEESHR